MRLADAALAEGAVEPAAGLLQAVKAQVEQRTGGDKSGAVQPGIILLAGKPPALAGVAEVELDELDGIEGSRRRAHRRGQR